MPVAAKFTDGKWYRGVIRDIPRPLQVQVQYVDFGNVDNVSWENIRILSPIFLRTGVLVSIIDVFTPRTITLQ